MNAAAFVVVITVSYGIMRAAPGKPFETERSLPPEVMAELHRKYDFGYWEYLSGILFRFDLRESYSHRDISVSNLIVEALPISMELGGYALAFALVGGLAMGLSAALLRGSWMESSILVAALMGIAVPSFVMGALAQLYFGLELRWFPIAGWSTMVHKILPSLTLSAAYLAYITRIARSSFLEQLTRDYVRTARAKGLSEPVIFFKHLLRNSVTPVISFLAPAAAALLTGTLVVEKIFNIPGMGRYFVESVFQRDYPLAMGVIVVYSLFLLTLNLLADGILAWVDPRTVKA